MKMRNALFCLLFFAFCTALRAQIPIGTFRGHVPLRSFHSVAAADDYVYAAADNGLMFLEKSTADREQPEISSWTKVEGLSDIDLTDICYDKSHKTLIVGYQNGNLDFIQDDKVHNVSDVKNKQIMGSKQLSSIRVYGDIAYLVYPFGIVTVDLNTFLIADSWFTKRDGVQFKANDIAISDDKYYLATDSGIFSIRKELSYAANFQEWQLETGGGEFDHLLYFGGKVIASKNCNGGIISAELHDTLYVLDGGEWLPTMLTFEDVRSLNGNDKEMIVGNWDYAETFDTELRRTFKATWYQDDGTYSNLQEAVLDGNLVWAADKAYGLILYNRPFFYHKFFVSDGPASYNAESMASLNGLVAVVPGSRKATTAYTPGYESPRISWFVNQNWSCNTSGFLALDPEARDLTNIAINPLNDREWYIASWGAGLFKCVDNQVTAHYTAANSPLDSTEQGKTFVSGLAFDSKGNLWITNSHCAKMLKMLEPDGTWHSYNIGSGVHTSSAVGVIAENLIVDSRGYKWVTFPRDDSFNKYRLVAFSESGTYDNTGDDKFARVDMNAAARVNSSTVGCIAEDLEGEIWIGTDKGIKVIYYPSNVFSGTARPNNILLEQDGYVSILLENETVTAIAVDGANRKWIGTRKAGVFLMSQDGQKQLLHFTAEDNPLFSNQINCIAINDLSGEVFFGTDKGIVSYQGEATKGGDTYSDLLVYPNPVRHGYTGPVAVKGLKTESLCKITDSSGRLVWQGYSKGGQLVWYGKDHYGNRPATGVYYVMASDEEGKESIVAKFLFIN